jgi:hypothetical protein
MMPVWRTADRVIRYVYAWIGASGPQLRRAMQISSQGSLGVHPWVARCAIATTSRSTTASWLGTRERCMVDFKSRFRSYRTIDIPLSSCSQQRVNRTSAQVSQPYRGKRGIRAETSATRRRSHASCQRCRECACIAHRHVYLSPPWAVYRLYPLPPPAYARGRRVVTGMVYDRVPMRLSSLAQPSPRKPGLKLDKWPSGWV